MDNTTLPSEKPVLVEEPPTVEYIEPKRNRKKIIEICAIIVIICIPIVLSLFKIDYSVKRIYEVVNPAYIGTSSDFGTWGGIVTAAKEIIRPVIHLPEASIAPTNMPTGAATPSPTPHMNQEQQSQHSEQAYPAQNQNEVQYPEGHVQYPPAAFEEQKPTATPTPTSTPTSTPPPPAEQQMYPNSVQVDAYASYTACYGKQNNASCSYQSSYGDKISGKCMSSGGYLMCKHGQ